MLIIPLFALSNHINIKRYKLVFIIFLTIFGLKSFQYTKHVLSTQNNAKLLQELKSDFKRIINWNKYPSKQNYYHKIQT